MALFCELLWSLPVFGFPPFDKQIKVHPRDVLELNVNSVENLSQNFIARIRPEFVPKCEKTQQKENKQKQLKKGK
jgi:hypothetical protein